jgi:hypothetical protein
VARWRRRPEPAEIPAWVFGAPADEMWQWLEDTCGGDDRRFFAALSAIMSTPVQAPAVWGDDGG